jgi:hypothetical protein
MTKQKISLANGGKDNDVKKIRWDAECVFFQIILALSLALTFSNAVLAGDREAHTGDTYAVNVPELAPQETAQVTWDTAKAITEKYRWIYVNASEKDVAEARIEALSLSNAVGGRPLVLVYLPRFIFGTDRNTYPLRFHNAMKALIEHATKSSPWLLVSGRSYGVHQALRAVRKFDKPEILVIGIAPAFGAFGNFSACTIEIGSPLSCQSSITNRSGCQWH